MHTNTEWLQAEFQRFMAGYDTAIKDTRGGLPLSGMTYLLIHEDDGDDWTDGYRFGLESAGAYPEVAR